LLQHFWAGSKLPAFHYTNIELTNLTPEHAAGHEPFASAAAARDFTSAAYVVALDEANLPSALSLTLEQMSKW